MSNNTQPLAHQVRKQLLTSPELYVESVGKPDMLTLNDVMNTPDGDGTVIRLVMGATTEMPYRALSYADAALRIARVIPCAQIQLIHTTEIGALVNGTDRERSRDQAGMLAIAVRRHMHAHRPELEGKVLQATDTDFDLKPYVALAREGLTDGDMQAIGYAGQAHRGDSLVYVGAHVAMHDTDQIELRPLLDEPDRVRAARVVSIGACSERPFYVARMAIRQLGHESFVDTAQVFTKHRSAPYFRRDGEPTLGRVVFDRLDIQPCNDSAAQRDIDHFVALQGADHA